MHIVEQKNANVSTEGIECHGTMEVDAYELYVSRGFMMQISIGVVKRLKAMYRRLLLDCVYFSHN